MAVSAPTSAPTPSRPSKKAQAKAEEDATAKKEAGASEVAARSDELVARVRRTLDAKGGSFDSFASLSSQFKSGQCSASSYVAKLRVMGLDLPIVNELAALMPDGDKRRELERAAAAAARLMGGGGAAAAGGVQRAAAILFGAGKRTKTRGLSRVHLSQRRRERAVRRVRRAEARCGGRATGGAASSSGGGAAVSGGGGGKKGKVKGRKVSLTAVGGGGVRGIDDIVDPGRSSRSAWGA